MANISGYGFAGYFRQDITKYSVKKTQTNTTADKLANVYDISIEQTTFEGVLFGTDSGVQNTPAEAVGAPDRWTSGSLYTLDIDTLKGYMVNHDALERVKEQLREEGIDADRRTPTHEITDEQMEWLGSRYDLDFLSACSFSHPDYGNFMLDLAYMNVFSLDEVENMYGVLPFNANHKGYLYKEDTGDGLSGYVNQFGGVNNYVDEDDLYTQLIMEYIKAKYTGHTDKEYERMTEDFKAQRTERMMIIEDFFARAAEKSDGNTLGGMDGARPNIENISEKLREDFGGLL